MNLEDLDKATILIKDVERAIDTQTESLMAIRKALIVYQEWLQSEIIEYREKK
jgi:hypothetical protein